MDPSYTWQLIILVILIALSSFFSASETALMSVNRIRVRHLVDEEVKGAKLLEKLLSEPNKLLGGILIGNNIVNIGASSIASKLAYDIYGNSGVALSTGVMTILVLIFGEITPKTIAKQRSEEISLKIINIINIIVKVLGPLVFVFSQVSQVFIKLLGAQPDADEAFITQEELKTMVGVSEEEGLLEEEEKEMIFNVFEFGDLQVKDVMVQRVDIIAVPSDVTYEEVLQIVEEEQFSRIPVYNETIDDIVGVINIKDLFSLTDEDKKNFDVKKYIREPFYTFEFKKIMELFAEMKKSRNHMSIVLDEYGGTVGIVTIEDVIEEVVGEIEDEYDQEEDEIQAVSDHEYILDGSAKLHDIKEEIGLDMESEEFDSIGGFIIAQIGRLPEVNEEIDYNDARFIVEDIDKNRIKKVRMFI